MPWSRWLFRITTASLAPLAFCKCLLTSTGVARLHSLVLAVWEHTFPLLFLGNLVHHWNNHYTSFVKSNPPCKKIHDKFPYSGYILNWISVRAKPVTISSQKMSLDCIDRNKWTYLLHIFTSKYLRCCEGSWRPRTANPQKRSLLTWVIPESNGFAFTHCRVDGSKHSSDSQLHLDSPCSISLKISAGGNLWRPFPRLSHLLQV